MHGLKILHTHFACILEHPGPLREILATPLIGLGLMCMMLVGLIYMY